MNAKLPDTKAKSGPRRAPWGHGWRRAAAWVVGMAWLVLALSALTAGSAAASDRAPERFAGEAQVGSQPPIPIHLELDRSGDTVTGIVAIPGARFEVEGKGVEVITGSFRGNAGTGALMLSFKGETLEGSFDLGGQIGVITARRTSQTAEAMFRPPEQRLDLTTAEWLEDLDRLADILTQEHAAPFHKTTRAAFNREVAMVRASLPNLDGAAAALAFRRLVAAIGDGHTRLDLPERPRLPVDLFWFEDGLRVVSISVTHRDLLSARLVAVDGVPALEVAERLRAYIPQGETELFHRNQAAELLCSPDLLRAIELSAGPSFSFTFEAVGGAEKQVQLVPAPASGARVVLGGGSPLWQRNATEAFRHERLADGSVYVNWRSYESLATHAEALLNDLDADHPRRLIVDLRDNDGGDYTLGRGLVEAIGRRPWLNRRSGLYVLIGRKTFSAGMTNAADFRHSTEAILVGEPAGAAPNNWQEVRRFHLPNSGLRVGVSTRYYEFLPGYPELRPDWLVQPETSDWGTPIDVALRRILDDRSSESNTP